MKKKIRELVVEEETWRWYIKHKQEGEKNLIIFDPTVSSRYSFPLSEDTFFVDASEVTPSQVRRLIDIIKLKKTAQEKTQDAVS